jgi:heme/copper-type cytochrome/quinol oxidase subunit 1
MSQPNTTSQKPKPFSGAARNFSVAMYLPRRISTYEYNRGWGDLNSLETFGAFVVAVSVIVFLINFVVGTRSPKMAPDDPWEANTLEWYTTSPPLVHNFDLVPEVQSARPLCDLRVSS